MRWERANVQLKLEKQKYKNMIATIKTKSKNISLKIFGNPQLIDDCEFLEIYNKARAGNVAAKEKLYYAKMLIIIKQVNTYSGLIYDYDEWMDIFSTCVDTLLACIKTLQPCSQRHFDNYFYKSITYTINRYFAEKTSYNELCDYDCYYDSSCEAAVELTLLKNRIYEYLKSKAVFSRLDVYIKAIYERLHLLDYNSILQDILKDTTIPDSTKDRYTYVKRAFTKISKL